MARDSGLLQRLPQTCVWSFLLPCTFHTQIIEVEILGWGWGGGLLSVPNGEAGISPCHSGVGLEALYLWDCLSGL